MTLRNYKPDTPIVQAVCRFVTENPGAGIARIADGCNSSASHAGKALAAARGMGLLGFVRYGGTAARWFPPQMLAEQFERARQARAITRQSLIRRKAAAAKARAADAVMALDDGVIQRTGVDPRAPLPFTVHAPASVFQLGGML